MGLGTGDKTGPGRAATACPSTGETPHHAEARGLPCHPVHFLFQIPEVLLWAKEQNEEKSPNLTQFTEHFNNMSYW